MVDNNKRLLGFRIQEGATSEGLSYPLSFLGSEEYPIEEILCPLATEEASLSVGSFPQNVTEWIWVHEGVQDEEPWHSLARLDSGLYIYYKAWCDYTGFDCQGGMKLYVSKNRPSLIQFAMDETAYRLYLKETVWFKNIPNFVSGLTVDDDV